MDFSYPKNEKLKSRKTIDLLFTEGKSVAKFPLRLVYAETDPKDGGRLKVGVSVSKKHFKKAVDRNYYKRVLRECYRLNKQLLLENTDRNFALLFLYQTKERLSYEEINGKTKELFGKFAKAVQQQE